MSELQIDINFLMIIAGRKMKEDLMEAISNHGGRLINVIYGKGSVKASYLMNAFGFAPEENKVVIACLFPQKKIDIMLKVLTDDFDFDKPNTGIAFTTTVDKLSF